MSGALTQALLLHRDPLGVLARLHDRHGPVFSLRLPTARRTVVVADPAEVGRVLATDPRRAAGGGGRRRMLGMVSPQSVLGADGAPHRAARDRVAPAFAPEAVARRRAAMAQIAEQHAERWPRGRPFKLLPRLRTLADDLFARLVVGVRDEQRATELAAATRAMLRFPGNPPLSPPAGNRGLLGVAGEALFQRRRAAVDLLLALELDARRHRGDAGDEPPDLIDCMVRAGRTTEQAVDELVPLLMAGQEPGAIALAWLLDRIGRTPGAAERFHPWEDAASAAFAWETFRLRPPVFAALRPLTEPARVAGRDLPAGVVLLVPFPLLHRDPDAFPDPQAFRPERFLPDPEAWPAAYAPFGGGARRCLGEPLARAQIEAVVPALLRRVRLRPLSRAPERQVLRATVLPPLHGVRAVASSR